MNILSNWISLQEKFNIFYYNTCHIFPVNIIYHIWWLTNDKLSFRYKLFSKHINDINYSLAPYHRLSYTGLQLLNMLVIEVISRSMYLALHLIVDDKCNTVSLLEMEMAISSIPISRLLYRKINVAGMTALLYYENFITETSTNKNLQQKESRAHTIKNIYDIRKIVKLIDHKKGLIVNNSALVYLSGVLDIIIEEIIVEAIIFSKYDIITFENIVDGCNAIHLIDFYLDIIDD